MAAFTVWNVIDFCKASTHSTAAYLAIMFNLYAILATVKIIIQEVRHGGK